MTRQTPMWLIFWPPAWGGRGRGAREAAWFFWIAVSTVGSVVSALVQWRIRTLLVGGTSVFVAHYLGYDYLARDAAYVATAIGAIVLSGAQWLLLRRYRLAVDWWVPATTVAAAVGANVLIPTVLRAVLGLAGSPAVPTWSVVMAAGGAAVAASGLLVGTAQWLVLRGSGRSVAIGWIPATVLGGVLAGSITTVFYSHLFGLPPLLGLSAAGALGGLLLAAVQGPILDRLLS